MGKILLIDVDGTLVNYENQLPASAASAIRKARANGHKVYICTGCIRRLSIWGCSEKSRMGEISIHPFQPLSPDLRQLPQESISKEIIPTNQVIYKKTELVHSTSSRASKKKSTIITAGLLMTNACLGTTIFTFGVKAKSFGLIWLLVATVVIGCWGLKETSLMCYM